MNKFIALIPIFLLILKNSYQAENIPSCSKNGSIDISASTPFDLRQFMKIKKLNLQNPHYCETCAIDIQHDHVKLDAEKKVHDKWPLILENSNNPKFIDIPSNGIRYISKGTMLRLVCTGSHNRFVNVRSRTSDIMVKCIQGKTYEYEGTRFEFEDFGCAMIPESEDFEISENHHQIGFRLPDNAFIPLIDIHYDTDYKIIHTTHMLSHSKAHQKISRINFMNGNHPLGKDIKKHYAKSVVSEEMTKLLGEKNSEKYFNEHSFITKGHMAPKGDFVFGSQQLATFYYINCNPQFSGLNNYNWDVLEISIRSHYFANEITIHTGATGILSLPSQSNKNESIYLAEHSKLPVPEVFWKVVETDDNKYAFLGFNYPTIDTDEFLDEEKDVCTDLCDTGSYSWLLPGLTDKKSRRNPTKGYIICCSFEELEKFLKDKNSS